MSIHQIIYPKIVDDLPLIWEVVGLEIETATITCYFTGSQKACTEKLWDLRITKSHQDIEDLLTGGLNLPKIYYIIQPMGTTPVDKELT